MRSMDHRPAPVWFLSRLTVGNGCWEWEWRKDKDGYGLFSAAHPNGEAGRTTLAHRYAYALLVGPIPSGLTLDHLCRNPGCVRPDHLEPVTVRDNILRGNGYCARAARRTHCPQGHPYTLDNLYQGRARVCKVCNRERCRRFYRARHPLSATGLLR